VGIDIPEVFACEGYFDRQMARGAASNTAEFALAERLRFWFGNKELGRKRYAAMKTRGDACTQCGECLKMCPYHIDIPYKMHLADYKLAGKDIY
jgi:predicted aldo/keto reductase-like oxidoreductase